MAPKERELHLLGDLITLGQLIKALDLIDSGAEAKAYLAEAKIWVNGEPENRRGKKLFAGDVVDLPGPLRVTIAPRS